MSDNSVIEVNDNVNKIEIEVDKIDDKIEVDKIDDKIDVDKNVVDKFFTFDDERHNGKSITMVEISPNEKYLITYSEEDGSIVGWNVEDIDKVQLEFHQAVKTNGDNKDKKYGINRLCVSDDKKLAYITYTITVIDMNNKKDIALYLNKKRYRRYYLYYCTFNLKGEFILYGEVYAVSGKHKIIYIYSTQTKNNKWEYKRFYEIPEDYELISISKYDKVYLFSNNHIYEWNINTERVVKIFGNNKDKNKFETKNIGIFSNDEKFIFLNINDKIIVYSIELGIFIASLDINDDIQLYNFMYHTGLFLLPSLFYFTSDEEIKYCWNNKYENMFNQIKPTDESTDDQTKFVFGIQNGRVWKSKFDEKMSKTNFSSGNSDELNKEHNKIVECDEYLNVHSFNLYMDTVSTLFQKVTTDEKELTESTENLIKWNISVDNGQIKLEVFKKINTKWESINIRVENYYYPYKFFGDFRNNHKLIASLLFSNDDIVILTTFGILIYTFSENNKSGEKEKSIFLNYFYFMKSNHGYMNMKTLQYYKRMLSKSTLPLPNYDGFRLDGWVSDIINNKSSLMKYGVELLKFAIKEHKYRASK
ncbi:uncharacterized protein OCT59_027194 [Rhizophagus irregularis]|uniref:uncharacterized protein n=1 Tax=Rhizophagus irregularis TaxID=588596 RepID=UPI0033191716|nr:hypothetical protein OCT59_027194 [Rhizophagus irregularis]